MYKLLIVEDNSIQIQSLMNYIDWKSYDVTQIHTASNGAEGLKEYKSFKPDILITDVAMPLMDGTEMVNKLREEGEEPCVIFISCYDDFDYMSSAIENSAVSYILKPIDQNQLDASVRKAINHIERVGKNSGVYDSEAEFTRLLRENFMYNMLYSNDSGMNYMNDNEQQLRFRYYSQFCIVKLDIAELNNIAVYKYIHYIKDELLKDTETVTVMEKENRIVILFMCRSDNGSEFASTVQKTVAKCISVGRERFDIIVIAALSNISKTYYEIPLLISQASYAFRDRKFLSDNDIYIYNRRSGTNEKYNVAYIRENIEKLIEVPGESEIKEFSADLCNLGKDDDEGFFMEMIYVSVWTAIQMIMDNRHIQVESVFGSGSVMLYKPRKFENILQLKTWIYNMIRALKEYIEKYGRNKVNDIISSIISYINQNYSTISNIEDIASHCYVSSSYARSLFEKVMGKTIFEYLLSVRMDRAKTLIMNNVKIYDVASMVGYESKTSFSLAFKKYTGMLPSEFRNHVQNNRR